MICPLFNALKCCLFNLKSFLLGFVFTILLSCYRCDDVRLGADGWVPCPQATNVLLDIVLRRPGNSATIALYENGNNLSTEKYVLSADFLTVTVRDMTVSDEGEYGCAVTHDILNPRLLPVTPVTISVFGESSAMEKCTCLK